MTVCFVCFMFDCVGELFFNAFAISVGEVNVFSFKVMVLFLGCVGFCWLVCVLPFKEYVCCVCDPSVCLGVPSICQICVLYEGCDFRV